MSGRNIKIELELPDFEKELNITVMLQRDGEVLRCTSSTSGDTEDILSKKNSRPEPLENFGKPVTAKQSVTDIDTGNGWKQEASSGNNMMNLSF